MLQEQPHWHNNIANSSTAFPTATDKLPLMFVLAKIIINWILIFVLKGRPHACDKQYDRIQLGWQCKSMA